MDHAGKGAAALAASDAATAVVEYTHALITHPTSPDYFVQRSTAFSRLKPPRHDLALQDADLGALSGRKRGRRDKIQAAQQRRMVSLYNLGRYADAKVVMDGMEKWSSGDSKPKIMEHTVWKAKVDSKMKLNPGQTATVRAELTDGLPEEQDLVKLLKSQLKSDGTFNYDGTEEVEASTQPTSTSNNTSQSGTSTSNPPATSTVTGPPQKIRHEFFQSPNIVTLTIYAKNVAKDKAEIEINADSVHISFPHPSDTSTDFNLSFDPLFALIDPSKSISKVMGTKIELSLAKAEPGRKWAKLEGEAPLTTTSTQAASADLARESVRASLTQSAAATTQAPSYPTSSKSGPKNWDKLAADLTRKPKSDAKPKASTGDGGSDSEPETGAGTVEDDDDEFGGDAVDGFFKKLYKGADADTQRAMMKSFYESNGTTLSTNWSEVGKGYVKPYDERKKDDDD